VCKVFSPPSNTKHHLDFSFVFSGPYLPEETCFHQVVSSAVEGTAVLGSFDQWKVPAIMSLFLKGEKIPGKRT
jgi:hypothetical protein